MAEQPLVVAALSPTDPLGGADAAALELVLRLTEALGGRSLAVTVEPPAARRCSARRWPAGCSRCSGSTARVRSAVTPRPARWPPGSPPYPLCCSAATAPPAGAPARPRPSWPPDWAPPRRSASPNSRSLIVS
ncbi:hypothetical protein ACFQ0T_09880 [Kitasatospora gansuensis]